SHRGETTHVKKFPRGAVGFRGVENQASAESHYLSNKFGQFTYGQFMTRADIYEWEGVAVGKNRVQVSVQQVYIKDASIRSVVTKEEVTTWTSLSPNSDLLGAAHLVYLHS